VGANFDFDNVTGFASYYLQRPMFNLHQERPATGRKTGKSVKQWHYLPRSYAAGHIWVYSIQVVED